MKVFLCIILLFGCVFAVPNSRIFGGEDAIPHEFPYMISFQAMENDSDDSRGFHFCGGSIMNNRWVLTAAHCINAFHKYSAINIVAGAHSLSNRGPNEQRRLPKKTVDHPQYKNKSGAYDIGLVELNLPLEFNQYVSKIQLPTWEPYYPIGQGIVSGWGSISNTLWPKYPDILQKAHIPIVPAYKCYDPDSAFGFTVYVTNFCAGPLDGSKSVCSGDSGGPLVQRNIHGESVQMGVVSWGWNPCGTLDKTGVFVNVSFFLQWIHGTVGTRIGCPINQ